VNTHARLSQDLEAQIGSERANGGAKTNGNMKAVAAHLPGNKSHKGATAYESGAEEHRTKAGLVTYAEKMRKLAEPGSGIKNNTSFNDACFACAFRPSWNEPCIRGGNVTDRAAARKAHFATLGAKR
jgi:hypothetical protein